MKRLLHTALLLWLALSTGCKDRDELNVMDDQGLGLYWHHEADGERGRHLLMSFINEKPSTDKFDYKFDFEVQGRVIDVRLVEKIPEGNVRCSLVRAAINAIRGEIFTFPKARFPTVPTSLGFKQARR